MKHNNVCGEQAKSRQLEHISGSLHIDIFHIFHSCTSQHDGSIKRAIEHAPTQCRAARKTLKQPRLMKLILHSARIKKNLLLFLTLCQVKRFFHSDANDHREIEEEEQPASNLLYSRPSSETETIIVSVSTKLFSLSRSLWF